MLLRFHGSNCSTYEASKLAFLVLLRRENVATITFVVGTFAKSERSRIMAAVKSRDTSPELVVRRLFHASGFRYRLHVRSLPGTPDMVFPRLKKIINVSGCFWHMHGCGRCRIPASHRHYWIAKLKRNAARDRRTTRALRRAGWSVLTVWECQTAGPKAARLRQRLEMFLSG